MLTEQEILAIVCIYANKMPRLNDFEMSLYSQACWLLNNSIATRGEQSDTINGTAKEGT